VIASLAANSEVARKDSASESSAPKRHLCRALSIFPHELPNDNQNGDKGDYRRYETKQHLSDVKEDS